MTHSRTIITGFDPAGPFAGLILPPRFRKRQAETRFKQEWKLTLAQYAAMMREFTGARKQRGSIGLGLGPTRADIGQVVITNKNFNADGIFPSTTISGVRWSSNGTTVEIDSETGNVDQTAQWWSKEPETAIGALFEVRATGTSGTWTVAAEVDNTWIQLNANRDWSVTETGASSQKQASATFEIGPNGASTAIDSASVTCTAANDL